MQILNNLGQLIREEEIIFKDRNTCVNTKELANGIYLLHLKTANGISISKRFVIHH